MEIQSVLGQLDQLFEEKKLAEVEPFLTGRLHEAIREGDAGSALTLWNELTGFYRSVSQTKQSLRAAEESLHMVRQMNLSGTIPHATTLVNAATAYRAAGDLPRALALYQEALPIFHSEGADRDYPMAGLLNNISQVYQTLNRHGDAVLCLNQALEILGTLSDAESETATTHSNLALSLLSLNRREEAQAHLEQAIALFESLPGNRDAHYGAALAALAELSYRTGDYARAVEYYESALREIRENFGDNSDARITEKNLQLVKKAWEESKTK